jgi:preprotein translocase subunit Sec61beta
VNGAGEFFDRQTGGRFVPRGANYVFVPLDGGVTTQLLQVGVYDPSRTRADFAALASLGFNTVRVFLDHCSSGPGCIADVDGEGLNPAYLGNIADMLAAASEAGIYILFTSNDLPDQGGYSEQANSQSGETFAGYRNSFYLTRPAVEATRRYWHDLVTGLIERGAATDRVLGWQLINEQWMFIDQPPLSLTSGTVETTTGAYDMSDPGERRRMVSEGLIHYIDEVRAEILTADPTALVTMGFFAPEIAAPGWYVETASLLAGSSLDFFDFHAYPGAHDLAEIAAAFGMAGFDDKPIVMGEYGAFRHIYPSILPAGRAITAWQAESCTYGFDGWLYWTYRPADATAGDQTWGLTDESGLLLEMLSPAHHPDPCMVVDLPNANLATRAVVRASASLPGEPPANAVDESGATQWGAGAHPPQWIEIDLGEPFRLTQIRLLVAQYPEGATVHRIRGRSAEGAFVDLHTFSQDTAGGDWLVLTPASPIDGVQIIRIDTLSSPSWVAWGEIEVYGEPEQ